MNDSREVAKPRRKLGAPTFKESYQSIGRHHQNFASSRLRVNAEPHFRMDKMPGDGVR